MAASYYGLVLLTGASGMLGFRTLVLALQAGYRVRIALRKKEQAEKIKNSVSVKPFVQGLEVVQVVDMTAEGAYDEAIRHVDHVIHIASPMPTRPQNREGSWQEVYYNPAIRGTLSILTAASRTSSVKTVVITSSVAILKDPEGSGKMGPHDLLPVISEDAANKLDMGRAYGMSKIMAHHAADRFIRDSETKFKLIRILPGLLQGPHELAENEEDLFGTTNVGTLNTILGRAPPASTSQTSLEDAARAHILALDSGKCDDGDVLIIVGSDGNSTAWDEYASRAASLFPKEVEAGLFKPDNVIRTDQVLKRYDVASSQEKLGFKFAGIEAMAEGVIQQYLRLREH